MRISIKKVNAYLHVYYEGEKLFNAGKVSISAIDTIAKYIHGACQVTYQERHKYQLELKLGRSVYLLLDDVYHTCSVFDVYERVKWKLISYFNPERAFDPK